MDKETKEAISKLKARLPYLRGRAMTVAENDELADEIEALSTGEPKRETDVRRLRLRDAANLSEFPNRSTQQCVEDEAIVMLNAKQREVDQLMDKLIRTNTRVEVTWEQLNAIELALFPHSQPSRIDEVAAVLRENGISIKETGA